MRRESRKVTGVIGGGFSGSPFAGSSKGVRGSIRVSSPRKTVRTKEVWVCGHSAACDDPDYYRRRLAEAEEKARQNALKAAEKARQHALKAAEKARQDALKAAEKARQEAERAEKERLAREVQEKIDALAIEIRKFINSSKVDKKFLSEFRAVDEIKSEFVKKVNHIYSRLPYLDEIQKTQFSSLATQTIESTRLGVFLYENGASVSSPLVKALPNPGKFKNGFFYGYLRLNLWALLFIAGLTTVQIFLDGFENSFDENLLLDAVIGTAGTVAIYRALKFFRKGYSKRQIDEASKQLKSVADDVIPKSNVLMLPVLPQVVDRYGDQSYFDAAIKQIFKRDVDLSSINIESSSKDEAEQKDKKAWKSGVQEVIAPGESKQHLTVKDAVRRTIESEDALSLITWILAEKVMHSDGVIEQLERDWFQSEFELGASDMQSAAVIAKDPKSLNLAVLMFNKLFPRHPKKRELLINNLLAVAVADGELAVEEEQVIRQIAVLVKMKEEIYQSMLDAMREETNKKSPSMLLAEDIFDELEELGDIDDLGDEFS